MTITGARSVVLAAILLFGATLYAIASQDSPLDLGDLIRQADFVGFVWTNPTSTSSTGDWRQVMWATFLDTLKTVSPGPADMNRLAADRFPPSRYPTWIAQKGEYFVFLKHEFQDRRETWTTIAAFQVKYAPNETGLIAGAISDGDQARISKEEARAILDSAVLDKGTAADLRSLEIVLEHVAAAAVKPEFRSISHEQRIAEAQVLAAAIKPGTVRADVEKIFPTGDGGLGVPEISRYYFGSEVMVEVPYDDTGGRGSPLNKVQGSIHVYRDRFHVD